MEKLGFGLDNDSATCDQKKRESCLLIVMQRCINQLFHTCHCRYVNCRLPSCLKMRRVILHNKNCKLNYECSICKQLLLVCLYHAKHCRQDAKCRILYCSSIKNRKKEYELQKAQILKSCIASMKNCRISAGPGNSTSSNQPSPGAQPHSSPHLPQPGTGMKPSTGPLVGALQAVQQVQALAAGQTDPHMVAASVNYGKGNPVISPPIPNMGLMAATQQMQKPVTQMMSRVPNHMLNMGNVACWEDSGFAQNPQPHQNPQTQPNPQLGLTQPTQLMGGPNNMSDSIGNSAMGRPQVIPDPGPSLGDMQKTWQQLLETLKSPPSAQQQQQVLAILKSNPQLMPAQQQQQQQAQMQEPVPQMMSGEPNCVLNMGNVACWEGSGYAQNLQSHQNPQTQPNPQFGLRQPTTQLMGGPNNMSDSIGNSAMGPPQVIPDPGPSLGDMQGAREAWQQLLETLKSPPSVQQQQQVLDILKSNPQLMAAFIKQRTAQQQQQQLMQLNEAIHNLNISK